jgi:hypothetical protein
MSGSGLSKSLIDQGADFLGQAVGIGSKETSTKRPSQGKVDSWTRECVRNAERKLYSNLFTCQIHIHSNSLRNATAVKSVLPSAMNKFRTFKTTKNQQPLTPKLKTPSRHHLRNNVLCNLWWTIPIVFLLFAGVLGWFNPLKFMFALSSMDLVLPVFAVSLAVCLFVAFKKRQPIVLSTLELAQMIGLPTAIEKLPVALGKVPTARMQLGTQQQTNEQNNNSSTPVNSETQKDLSQSGRHRLKAAP